jgi:YbbR domain-containing protein
MSQRRTTDDRLREAFDISRDALLRSWRTMRSTPGLLLLSLLLGAALWVFVTEEENPTRIDTLSTPLTVQAFNVEPGLAVANQLPAVEVRLAAPDERWDDIAGGAGSFSAFVDLNGVTERDQEVRVQVEIEGLRGVRVVETIPETITVNLEDLTSIEVPVRVRPVGTLPLGYELGSTSAEQSTVTIIGPESLVVRVNDAVADLTVTGLTLSFEQTVALVPRGAGGGEIRGVSPDPPSLSVSIEIRRSTLVQALPLRARTDNAPATGYRVANVVVSPATISIEGTLDALTQLEAIDLDPIDITGAQTDVTRAVTIELPDGVSSADSLLATVVVQIAPIDGSLTLDVVPEFINVLSGIVATPELPTIEVTLTGPLPVLNTLTAEDISLTVDLDGFGAGTYELEPSLDLPEGVIQNALRPETVSVTLTPG